MIVHGAFTFSLVASSTVEARRTYCGSHGLSVVRFGVMLFPMSFFDHIRQSATTRLMRVVAMAVIAMCSVTWVAQAVSAVEDGRAVATLKAAAEKAEQEIALADAALVDCGDEEECESVPLVALDETHDAKVFFIREFTHIFQAVVARMPRNRDLAAILRMSSETFRPPDQQIGFIGRLLAS